MGLTSTEDTESRTKNYIPTSGKIDLHHTKQYSHSLFAEVFKIKWAGLAGTGLTFYQHNKQDYRQFASSSVTLIPKCMGLTSTEDPFWACPSDIPDVHGLVEADLPRGEEYGSHVVIPCLNHMDNFPQLINI